MISNKRSDTEEKKEESTAYLDEILPDLRNRTRATIDNIWSVSEENVSHVGVQEMSVKSRMGKYFVEFASNSSIHGVNHLAARHRHPLERVLALVFIIGGLVCFICISVIYWYRYQDNGFILKWDYQKDLVRVVKPALIICPEKVLNESKFPQTFRRYGVEDTPQARNFFNFLSNLVFKDMINTPNYDGAPAELWLRIMYDSRKEIDYETTYPREATWIATDEGLCFSIGSPALLYNSVEYLLANNWTILEMPMYPPEISDHPFTREEIDNPKYLPSYICDATNCNITEALYLNEKSKIAFVDPTDGYRLMGFQGAIGPPGRVHILLRTASIIIADGKEKESARRRKCKIPMDKGLKLWPIYTYRMCTNEYRVNIIKRKCGCYPHYVRRISGVPVCNATQLRCAGKLREIDSTNIREGIASGECLYNCNYTRYIHDPKGTPPPKQNFSLSYGIYINMTMYYSIDKLIRKEIFSFLDFLTAVGGAAGLFLGCSVLSFIEIFYYGTLRLFIYKRKQN